MKISIVILLQLQVLITVIAHNDFGSDKDFSNMKTLPYCHADKIPQFSFTALDTNNFEVESFFENDIIVQYNASLVTHVRLACNGAKGGIVNWDFYGHQSVWTPYQLNQSVKFETTVYNENDPTFDIMKPSSYQTQAYVTVRTMTFKGNVRQLLLTCQFLHPSPCKNDQVLSISLDNSLSLLTSSESRFPMTKRPEGNDKNDVTFYMNQIPAGFDTQWKCVDSSGTVLPIRIATAYPTALKFYTESRHKTPRVVVANQTCQHSHCVTLNYNTVQFVPIVLICSKNGIHEDSVLVVYKHFDMAKNFPRIYTSNNELPMDIFFTFEEPPHEIHTNDTLILAAYFPTEFQVVTALAFTKTDDDQMHVLRSKVQITPTNLWSTSFKVLISIIRVTEEFENISAFHFLVGAWNGTGQGQIKKTAPTQFRSGLRANGCTLKISPTFNISDVNFVNGQSAAGVSPNAVVFNGYTVSVYITCSVFYDVIDQEFEFIVNPNSDVTYETTSNTIMVHVRGKLKETVLVKCRYKRDPCRSVAIFVESHHTQEFTVISSRRYATADDMVDDIPPKFLEAFPANVSEHDDNNMATLHIVGAVVVVIVPAFMILLLVVYLAKSLVRKCRSTEIEGDIALNNSFELQQYVNDDSLIDLTSGSRNAELYRIPINSEKIISRKKLFFDTSDRGCLLGSGAFGKVYKGKATFTEENVAIKEIRFLTSDKTRMNGALCEIKILAALEHPNVVQFYGVSVDSMKSGTIYAVFEICELGNLKDVLTKSSAHMEQTYVLNNTAEYKNFDNVSFLKLVDYSSQFAHGMKYLEDIKVIHGDLAARNLLLNKDNRIKISDFGLSKQLLNYYEYVKKSETPLPWRWMPPEVLRHMRFSSKSDVWSFGVTLYEIFSLGDTPYIGLNWTNEFVELLENGQIRPSKPKYASDKIWKILQPCFHIVPKQRVGFANLVEQLESVYVSESISKQEQFVEL